MTNDKKLSQINQIRLLSIKTISYNSSGVLKNHRLILIRKPASHPLLQLWHRHLVPVSLIPNQLVIQSGEQWTIIQCCGSEYHRGEVRLTTISEPRRTRDVNRESESVLC